MEDAVEDAEDLRSTELRSAGRLTDAADTGARQHAEKGGRRCRTLPLSRGRGRLRGAEFSEGAPTHQGPWGVLFEGRCSNLSARSLGSL